jgi:tricarballylate dehydrogenase
LVESRDCDVLVVGTGLAGTAAALAAAEAGARVIVLDKGPRELAGGTTRMSGGGFRGIRDNYRPEDLYNDVMLVTRGRADPNIARHVADNADSLVKWLGRQGVEWVDLTKPKSGEHRMIQARKVRSYTATPIPLELAGVRQQGFGNGLVQALHKTLFNAVTVRFETKAEKLLVDGHRRITGLRAYTSDDGYVDFRAPVVVLATGGFQANLEWRVRYFSRLADEWIVRGSRFSTGDGHRMAMEIGAAPAGQWGDFHTPVLDGRSAKIECGETNNHSYPYTLMINKFGQRFVDEGEDYRDRTVIKFGKEVLFQPDGNAWLIYDQKVRELVRGAIETWPPTSSEDLGELATQMGIDRDGLLETVEAYNAAVQPGEFDPLMLDGKHTVGIKPAKSNWAMTVDTPPYFAYPVTGGISYGFGGLKIDTRSRVLDMEDRPIVGLYAAGEMVGGLFYYAYASGSTLTWAGVIARTAGVEAANAAKAERVASAQAS